MDVAKVRHLAEMGLGGFDTLGREDAIDGAICCLADILEHVADDPAAIDLVRRIEVRFGYKWSGGDRQNGDIVNGETAPTIFPSKKVGIV